MPKIFKLYNLLQILQIKKTKSQATISILENIEIFAEKSTENDFKNELLPIVLNAFDSKNSEIQVSTFLATFAELIWLIEIVGITIGLYFSGIF